MAPTLYRYILENGLRSQIVVFVLTLALLPLAPIPLELQRQMLNEAMQSADFELLIHLGGLYLGVLLLNSALKFVMKLQRETISARIVHSLRQSVYHCIYTVVPPSKLRRTEDPQEDRVDEGVVVSMLTSEVTKLGGFAGAAISGPVLEVGTVLVVIGYMLWVEPLVALIAIGLYSPQFLIVPFVQHRINELSRDSAMQIRELSGFIVANAESELIGTEPPDRFVALTDNILALRVKSAKLKHAMKTINNLLMGLGPLGVMTVGGWMVMKGELEVGVVLAFISGLERLGSPIRDLIGYYRQLTDARMRYQMLLNAFPAHSNHGPVGV